MKTQTEKTDSRYSAADLAERALYRRCVEAVIWGMPAVNTDLMYQAMAAQTRASLRHFMKAVIGPCRLSPG